MAAVSLSAESYTYQTITAPGATSTDPVGIDNQGQIVGNYTNSLGTCGFIDTGGTFTTLPGVKVINSSSNGTLLVSTANGFATYFNGKYSPLTIPGYAYYPPQYNIPPFPITPAAINNSGQLLGNAVFNVYTGQFLVQGNQVTLIGEQIENPVEANGLNDQGSAVANEYIIIHGGNGMPTAFGAVYNSSTGNWIYVQAVSPGLPFPVQAPTDFNAINNLGQVVGSVMTYNNGFGSAALLYSNGAFTYLDVPDTNNAFAMGINDLGEIVGVDSSINLVAPDQGFLAIPETNTAVPEPMTGILGILGLAVVCTLKSNFSQRR